MHQLFFLCIKLLLVCKLVNNKHLLVVLTIVSNTHRHIFGVKHHIVVVKYKKY